VITIYSGDTLRPDNLLAGVIIVVAISVTVALAAFAGARWRWRAIPIVLLIGVTVPCAVAFASAAIVEMAWSRSGAGGALQIHLGNLVLFLGLPSALIPYGLTLVAARSRPRLG